MSSLRSLLFCAFCLGFAAMASEATAQPSDLLPPQRRAASVETADRIVAPRTPGVLPGDIKNPFAPPGFDQEEVTSPGGGASGANGKPVARSSQATLELIAGNISPTGTMNLRGEPILLFSGKQVRVGEDLTVAYDGNTHVLKVTAIDRTSFTVRLNNDEFTRPIKMGSKP